MFMLDPKRMSEMGDEHFEPGGYMSFQKSRMEAALKTANLVPNPEALQEASEFIEENAEIKIDPPRLLAIFSLYPIQRGKLADYGWGDTEVSDLTLDVVANYIAGTRWPIGKDNLEIEKFMERLKAAARFMGFETVDSQ